MTNVNIMMMMMTTAMGMMTMTLMMKKMGNQVVGKWVQSSWQMGVLASLNVRLLLLDCSAQCTAQ